MNPTNEDRDLEGERVAEDFLFRHRGTGSGTLKLEIQNATDNGGVVVCSRVARR